ncbi:MAG: hypothetical protein ACXWDQ_02945, partial [Solirubrobacterales bacterium]
ALCALGMLALASSAGASTGGAAPPGGTTPPATTTPTGPPGKATLLADGSALAPAGAPPQVVTAIAAANTIRLKPYIYGGGHRNFFAKGYDCSGAVSYMLHGGGLLTSPLPSGPLMRFGAPGYGTWISVLANRGHAYAVVAGLRWDTSAVGESLNAGSGPRWRATRRAAKGYVARHYPGL